MSALTELGKILRKLRIDKGERLYDMARKLGKSPSFLSSVETGRKPPPLGFEERIVQIYGLDAETADDLRRAASDLRREIRIRPKTARQHETVALMARCLPQLTEEQIEEIAIILREHAKE